MAGGPRSNDRVGFISEGDSGATHSFMYFPTVQLAHLISQSGAVVSARSVMIDDTENAPCRCQS